MRSYELTLILRSSLKDSEKAKLLDTIEGFIKAPKMTKEEWGQKPLSYPIKRELSGFYVNYMMDLEVPIPLDFEKRVLTADGVLRHLLTKTDGKTQVVKKVEEPKTSKEPVKKTIARVAKTAKAKK